MTRQSPPIVPERGVPLTAETVVVPVEDWRHVIGALKNAKGRLPMGAAVGNVSDALSKVEHIKPSAAPAREPEGGVVEWREGREEGRLAERPWRKGDPVPAVGSMVLVSGVHADIDSDQHRAFTWRRVIGYGVDGVDFICLQTKGCWPTVERMDNCWFAALTPKEAPAAPSERELDLLDTVMRAGGIVKTAAALPDKVAHIALLTDALNRADAILTEGLNGAPVKEAPAATGEEHALRAHFKAMQVMAMNYLIPEDYRDREGNVTFQPVRHSSSEYVAAQFGNRAIAFANDMLYMLDGPEERAALRAQPQAREEAQPVRFGNETAEQILRRWADWIIDVSADMEEPEWGGKTDNDVKNERDFLIRAITAAPTQPLAEGADAEKLREVLKRAEQCLTSIASGARGHIDGLSISALLRDMRALQHGRK